MSFNLSKAAKVTRVSNAAAAGTSTVTSSSVDMKAFSGVQFMVAFGTIVSGAATSVKLQTSSDDSSFNDLLGTAQTVADDDDNKVFLLDLAKPLERYIRVIVSRATQNSTVDGIIAQQYNADAEAVTHDSTVGGSEFAHAVAEGTA